MLVLLVKLISKITFDLHYYTISVNYPDFKNIKLLGVSAKTTGKKFKKQQNPMRMQNLKIYIYCIVS